MMTENNYETDIAYSGDDIQVYEMPIKDSYKVSGFHGKRHLCTGCRNQEHSEPNLPRCKEDRCECKCSTHYIGNNGKLIPYGTPDTTINADDEFDKNNKTNSELERLINQVNSIAVQDRKLLQMRKERVRLKNDDMKYYNH